MFNIYKSIKLLNHTELRVKSMTILNSQKKKKKEFE